MSAEHPTRRELMRPVQLLGLSVLAALFAGLVTLVSMGFFQQRYPGEALHALQAALIVAGITFIVTIVVISLLLLAVKPAEFTTTIDKPVLISHEEALAERSRAAEAKKARDTAAGTAQDAASGASGDADPRSERGDSAAGGPDQAS